MSPVVHAVLVADTTPNQPKRFPVADKETEYPNSITHFITTDGASQLSPTR